jgi:hypothetical protein
VLHEWSWELISAVMGLIPVVVKVDRFVDASPCRQIVRGHVYIHA